MIIIGELTTDVMPQEVSVGFVAERMCARANLARHPKTSGEQFDLFDHSGDCGDEMVGHHNETFVCAKAASGFVGIATSGNCLKNRKDKSWLVRVPDHIPIGPDVSKTSTRISTTYRIENISRNDLPQQRHLCWVVSFTGSVNPDPDPRGPDDNFDPLDVRAVKRVVRRRLTIGSLEYVEIGDPPIVGNTKQPFCFVSQTFESWAKILDPTGTNPLPSKRNGLCSRDCSSNVFLRSWPCRFGWKADEQQGSGPHDGRCGNEKGLDVLSVERRIRNHHVCRRYLLWGAF